MKPSVWMYLVVALTALCGRPGPAAAPDALVATATVVGPVSVNGAPVSGPAVTLGDGDRLETGAKGGAVVMLSQRDSLVVADSTSIVLRRQHGGVSAQLERGRVLVMAVHERLREVRLAGDAISIRAPRDVPRRYQVTRLDDTSYVYARAGTVSIFDEGYATEREVPEGYVGVVRPEAEAFAAPRHMGWEAPRRPAGASPTALAAQAASTGRRAGEITAAIPKDYVLRAGQRSDGNVKDVVQWDDILLTEPRGRVRVVLDDGSILSVGSGGRLEVVEHNAQSQQTNLYLRYGRVRAQVVKLAQRDSRFEIRTNTALCGVLGTDFYVEATERSTRVVVFQGIVRVTPLVAGAVAGVAAGAARAGTNVSAGQATTAVAGSVSAPTAATAAQIQTAVGVTAVGEQAAQAGALAGTAGTTAASRVAVVAAASAPPAAAAAVAIPVVAGGPTSPATP